MTHERLQRETLSFPCTKELRQNYINRTVISVQTFLFEYTYFYMFFSLTAERPQVVDEPDHSQMMNRRDISYRLRQAVRTMETTQAAGLGTQSNTTDIINWADYTLTT